MENGNRTVVSISKPIHTAVKIKIASLGITLKEAADQAFMLWLKIAKEAK